MPAWLGGLMRRQWAIGVAGIFAFFLIVIFVLAYLIDEPLRRKVERDMNARLQGYTVRVGKLDFHPIGLSLDLEELWIYQTAHPDPPIAYIPTLHSSVRSVCGQIRHRPLISRFRL